MFIAWVVFHVLVCIALILVVLMQSAKGEGLAGGTAFGGGVSNAVFGGRGAASFLSRSTTWLAIVFFLNCGALAFMSSSTRTTAVAPEDITTSTVTERAQQQQEQLDEQQRRIQEAARQDSLATADTLSAAGGASNLLPPDTSGN